MRSIRRNQINKISSNNASQMDKMPDVFPTSTQRSVKGNIKHKHKKNIRNRFLARYLNRTRHIEEIPMWKIMMWKLKQYSDLSGEQDWFYKDITSHELDAIWESMEKDYNSSKNMHLNLTKELKKEAPHDASSARNLEPSISYFSDYSDSNKGPELYSYNDYLSLIPKPQIVKPDSQKADSIPQMDIMSNPMKYHEEYDLDEAKALPGKMLGARINTVGDQNTNDQTLINKKHTMRYLIDGYPIYDEMPLSQIGYRKSDSMSDINSEENEKFYGDISEGELLENDTSTELSQNLTFRNIQQGTNPPNTPFDINNVIQKLPFFEDIPIYYRRLVLSEYMKEIGKPRHKQ